MKEGTKYSLEPEHAGSEAEGSGQGTTFKRIT